MLALAVLGSALAIGTVHTATLVVVTVVLAVCVLVSWPANRGLRALGDRGLLLLGIAAILTAYTGLQCVPMPVQWLSIVAPHSADVWSRSMAPFGERAPEWAPLSMDPSGTRVAFLRGIAYMLALIASLLIARKRNGGRYLASVVVATGLVLAIAALLHPALGVQSVFGIYKPEYVGARHIAPLLNPNNLAGYLNLAFCLALAAVLGAGVSPRLRQIAGVCVGVIGGVQLWIGSRSGVAMMVSGGVLVIALSFGSASGGKRLATPWATIAGAIGVAVGIVLIVLGGSEDASTELFEVGLSKKAEVFREAAAMVPSSYLAGCGRGAFESVFPFFRASPGYMTAQYPENVVLQWVIEWGVIVGGGGLAAIAYALRPDRVLRRSPTAAGAWSGLVVVAVQNLVDLGSEVPGLMIGCVVCAAVVASRGASLRSAVETRGIVASGRAVRAACALAAVLGLTVGGATLGKSLRDDQQRLLDAASTGRMTREEFLASAHLAMGRHPAEPYLPFLVAQRAVGLGEPGAMPWLEATLERATVYGPAHLLLGVTVARQSPAVARFEFRLAAEQAPELTWNAMRGAEPLVTNYQEAMEIIPQGPSAAAALEHVAASVADRLPATRVRLDEALVSDFRGQAIASDRLGLDAVQDVEGAGAPWCGDDGRAACVAYALRKTEQCVSLEAGRCAAHALHARALVASGRAENAEEAMRELEHQADHAPDRLTCLRVLVVLARRVGDARRLDLATREIGSDACVDDRECRESIAWLGADEEGHGDFGAALALYRKASARWPGNDEFTLGVVRAALALGMHVEAMEAYSRLARRHPDDPQWTDKVAQERMAVLREGAGAGP